MKRAHVAVLFGIGMFLRAVVPIFSQKHICSQRSANSYVRCVELSHWLSMAVRSEHEPNDHTIHSRDSCVT